MDATATSDHSTEDRDAQPAEDSAQCQSLATAYYQAIAAALACQPDGGADQCKVTITEPSSCHCKVFVNGGASIDQLNAAGKAWDDSGCVHQCTGACGLPTGATCTANPNSPSTGTCLNSM